nr:MAG TPA: dihydroorotate dehydrogenase B-like protein [Caudoviricetes sp.]
MKRLSYGLDDDHVSGSYQEGDCRDGPLFVTK